MPLTHLSRRRKMPIFFSVATALLLSAFVFNPTVRSQESFLWETSQAEVVPTGDLKWSPQPFEFEPGESVRYIDFENGDNANPGTREAPWKHHPWDPSATGQAKSAGEGIDTYVFKGGVIYRGHLIVPKGLSGSAEKPIRITRDPSWGEGEAAIYGAEIVTGWQQGSQHADIPEPEKVWTADLDFAPRALWIVDEKGEITRIHLARTPNWREGPDEDVLAEWFEWENPRWWEYSTIPDPRAGDLKRGVYGIDTKNLTMEPDYYLGAIVRTQYGIVMGTPTPSKIEGFDPKARALTFATPYLGSGRIIKGHRYYLEDKPHYLDAPGEFWFRKTGAGGTLHLRLHDDLDPNQVALEAARHINLIDGRGVKHLEISGLTFRFTNNFQELEAFFFQHPDVLGACVRNLGPASHVRVSHCVFEHVQKAVRFAALDGADLIDTVGVTDNDIRFTDHGAIDFTSQAPRRTREPHKEVSVLRELEILRNRIHDVGFRVPRMSQQHAIWARYPETAHVAGNIISRTGVAGMDVSPPKHGWPGAIGIDQPYVRLLVHHNKVTDTLMTTNDFGSIYVCQGGPGYIFNNVVRRPGGLAQWKLRNGRSEAPRFGHAYYADGGYQRYFFNNIATGAPNELGSLTAGESAFQTLWSLNAWVFNNTAWRFTEANRNQTPQWGRWLYLGNIYQDVSKYVFRSGNPPKEESHNEADAKGAGEGVDLTTFAYADNAFHKITGSYGLFRSEGRVYEDLEPMREAMKEAGMLAWEVGQHSEESLLRDPDNYDMRPTEAVPQTAAKVFVPWPLYAVVGEWHFFQNHADPAEITDYHWYMQAPYTDRRNYIDMPRWPLRAEWASESSYTEGALEDWTAGALKFQGQPAVLPHETLMKDVTYTDAREKKEVTVPAGDFHTVDMGTNSFLVEAYLQPGGPGGVLVEKTDGQTGYRLQLNEEGKPEFMLMAGGTPATVTGSTPLDPDQVLHLVAEADRAEGKLRLYLNGKALAEAPLELDSQSSLTNPGDFLVGRDFQGSLDFLRVSRGTLKDARTTIEELHQWQGNGPFLQDFAGRSRQDHPTAGALRE